MASPFHETVKTAFLEEILDADRVWTNDEGWQVWEE